MKTLIVVSILLLICDGNCRKRFQHHARGSDFGHLRDWELHSRGTVSHIVNLDTLPDVRVAENNKGEVILNLRNVTLTSGWQPGWFIMATNVRQRHGSKIKHVSIIKRIRHVNVVSPSKALVQGQDVSPMELLNEASVILRYPRTAEHKGRRQRRYVSNLLSSALDKINFKANDSNEIIGFNLDPKSGNAMHEYNIYKQKGLGVNVTKVIKGQTAEIPTEADFLLKCKNCFEVRTVGQALHLEIERHNKTAHLKDFIIQNDVSTTLNMDFEIEFKGALGIKEKLVLNTTPQTTLRTIPLAVVDVKLPPIQLVITYSKTVYLEINATSDGPIKYGGKYQINGTYISSSHERSGESPKTEVTTTGWSISGSSFNGHSEKPYNISIALYQEVTLQAAVKWSVHDVSLVFTPPEVTSFRPVFYAQTTENVFRRCENATLTVTGVFRYDKSDFEAKVFHKTIWDLVLRKSNLITKAVGKENVLSRCQANCFGHADDRSNSMDAACGAQSDKIKRGDKNFNKLTLVGGDFILFWSEESQNSSWCGTKGRQCRKCVWTDNNDDKNNACADRLMTSKAAEGLTTLGQFVAEEWPNKKLVVVEAWDEPTSQDIAGSHGVTSLHYEGRALQVTLSMENPSKSSDLHLDVSPSILNRLADLAVCSGFPYVDVTSGRVQMCVSGEKTTSNPRTKRSMFYAEPDDYAKDQLLRTLNKLGTQSIPLNCKKPKLYQGDVFPPGQSRDDVINPILEEHDFQTGLIQYTFNDTDFAPEGIGYSTCYKPTRKCRSSCEPSESEEPWDWCQTRAMTPRMAVRLRRLAVIVKEKTKVGRITVTKPIFNDHIGTKKGIDRNKDYELHGRTLRISSTNPDALSINDLRSFAVCAGFDFIEASMNKSIDVYVKLQNGFQSTVVPFQHVTLLPVKVKDPDYSYPADLQTDTRKPFLFDGFNKDIQLSEHFKISHFKHSEKRFFRLDPYLVDCLEEVIGDLEEGFDIVPDAVYRSHSINMLDVDSRHTEERYRFQTGQAAYLKPKSTKPEALIDIAQYILRLCTPVLRLQSRGLGIGCHSDKLYVDIRPMTSENVTEIADVWDVDNQPLFDNINKSLAELKNGGPAIFPLNLKRTCKEPRLSHDYAYFSFNSRGLGFCFHDRESKFCKATKEYRETQTEHLRDQLIKVAGTTLTRGQIEKDLRACVYDNCGGCPGKGPTWHKKVEGCMKMMHTFLEKARNPFKNVVDEASFFNTENPDSSVHSLACHDGSKCVEDTQIYSLIMPLLNSKYKPDPKLSQEELLYSGHDNPSPLIALVEQEFAYQVGGVVKIYIESESDMAILRDVIKVLMIYNRDVTEVEFHITDDVDEDNVISALQRKLEHWAGTTCPMWSRFAVAPYSVHVIPHHRKKRSLERSKNRNDVKRSIKDWEIEWIKKM